MTDQVFRLRSTITLPLDDVRQFAADVDAPAAVADVELAWRNSTLLVKSVPVEGAVGEYTATAQLRASTAEKREYETEDGEWSTTRPETHSADGPRWGSFGDDPTGDDEEPSSRVVEYASFHGDREAVLQNTELQYPMFEVLCDLARHAEKGSLVAIAAVGDELEATRIVDGEERPATIEIVEDPGERDGGGDAGWQDNPFIDSD